MSSGVKIALGIEYDGSRYYGWQRQQEVASVQGELEKALVRLRTAPSPYFVPEEPMLACMRLGR